MSQNTNLEIRTDLRNKISLIDAELKNAKTLSESPYKTNGEFRFNPRYTGNSPINIQKEDSLELLLSILSYLTAQSKNYIIAAEEIAKLTIYPKFK